MCESMGSVGAQWELRQALTCTDQRLGYHDASVRAPVDRRVPRVTLFRLLFERARAASVPDGKIGSVAAILRRLGRAGSPAVVRPPAPGSPGPPRSEPAPG